MGVMSLVSGGCGGVMSLVDWISGGCGGVMS